jgi:TolB-like protein/class 3 adenylate cyclase
MPSSRQLVAIMFTDIVGYTAIMQRNEDEAVALAKRYLAVLRESVEKYKGRILNDYGDGSLCIFPSAADALRCATEMQHQLQQPPEVPLRIGLHIGEVFFEEGKVFGDGVNIASRIQSLGIAGAVLLSKKLYDTIRLNPQFRAVSLGIFRFKNVELPAEVYALTGAGLVVPQPEEMEGKLEPQESGKGGRPVRKKLLLIAAGVVVLALALFLVFGNWKWPGVQTAAAAGGQENAIAVLYFNNMSGDPAQEYFSDGITEEIITRLSMIKGLKVKSRTSVLQYKGKSKSIRQIAKELGVKHILEGSVRKQGAQLRVSAQLVDATRDEHIWADTYDRELKDVFAVQSDIARNIASRFQITLSDDTRKRLEAPLTANTEAYDLFLRARSLIFVNYGLGGRADNRLEGMELLRRALALDPSFADAYALLSVACSMMSRDAADPQRWIDSAGLLATSAVEYAPDKPEGYAAMATLYENTGELNKALEWALKAHELQPSLMAGYISDLYARHGQFGKAMEWTLKAIADDPAEPANYLTKSYLFYNVGLTDSARRYVDMAVRLRPNESNAAWAQGVHYRNTRNLEAYEKLIREIFTDRQAYNYNMGMYYLFGRQWALADSFYRGSDHPDDIDAALARERLGDTRTARQYFDRALQLRLAAAGTWDHWRYYDVARIYAALGDERYEEYFQKAIRAGWHEYPFFERDPFFDKVRPTATYRQIALQMRQRNNKFKTDLLRSLQP